MVERRSLRLRCRPVVRDIPSSQQLGPRPRYLLKIEGASIVRTRHVANDRRPFRLHFVVHRDQSTRLAERELTAFERADFGLARCRPTVRAVCPMTFNRQRDGLVALIACVTLRLALPFG